jgi:lipopolysaccharide/colanic/teichoic acid biosynthesis glycosyltransferase
VNPNNKTARAVHLTIQRVFDIMVSLLLLSCFAPLLAAIALTVKLDSAGPIIFKQTRVGKDFREFVIFKFRTMVADASIRGAPITVGQDWRITRVGKVLRRWKIDELPQLINVLKGDMSLVGPRPEIPKYVELFHDSYKHILSVRPGVTDPASIEYLDESTLLGCASDPESEYIRSILPRKLALAHEYVLRRSLRYDIILIFKTLGRLF